MPVYKTIIVYLCIMLIPARVTIAQNQVLGKIDRAILSSDANPMYLDFWPLVAKAWQRIGIRPTLALIAPATVTVDESLGDVIRFEPIEGVSTALYAQVIRLFLPAYFEEDVCILSDIDMLPINKEYYLKDIINLPRNSFVVYRESLVDGSPRYSMCYNVACGKTFKEIFTIEATKQSIINTVIAWSKLGLGWNTDEIMLYNTLFSWQGYKSRCIKLGHQVERRIDRGNWIYDAEKLKNNYYIDSHMIRPYSHYKIEIDKLAVLLNIT